MWCEEEKALLQSLSCHLAGGWGGRRGTVAIFIEDGMTGGGGVRLGGHWATRRLPAPVQVVVLLLSHSWGRWRPYQTGGSEMMGGGMQWCSRKLEKCSGQHI